MSIFAQSHQDIAVREVASKVSALITSLRCLDIAVKQNQDGTQIYFESLASATGTAHEDSQRLIRRIGREDSPPTSAPSQGEAPTTE
jgi:hypothetical protein